MVTVWGSLATVFIIIAPLVTEGMELKASLKARKNAPPPMHVEPSGKPANLGPTPEENENETKDSHGENGGVMTALWRRGTKN